jgi:hypothetical protein
MSLGRSGYLPRDRFLFLYQTLKENGGSVAAENASTGVRSTAAATTSD